jgi:hypothetical protein
MMIYWEWMYSSTHSSLLHEMEQPHDQAAFLPKKRNSVPVKQDVVWAPEPVWTFGKKKAFLLMR